MTPWYRDMCAILARRAGGPVVVMEITYGWRYSDLSVHPLIDPPPEQRAEASVWCVAVPEPYQAA